MKLHPFSVKEYGWGYYFVSFSLREYGWGYHFISFSLRKISFSSKHIG
jgi:transcription initiation factor IIF auxiliary subunit